MMQPQHIKSQAERASFTRRDWLKLATGACAAIYARPLVSALAQPSIAVESDQQRAGATFTNPLFAGDYPDPTILRVGADFYMTHTSFSCTPGLVVWHSQDLVNWMPISNAVNNPKTEIWAPDMVEHDGRYFIYFPMGGVYVVHADHPRGPWSEIISLKMGGIDPGHVAGPDGKRYLYTAGGGVIELSADGLSTVGEHKQVYKGWVFPSDWKTEGMWLESPKLTKRGKYYYLVCAEGGTSGPPTSHMSIVARSDTPLGPWENSPYNPLIHTYSADEEWWSVGHGTLVSTPDDRWYFVYHGYRKNYETLGRNTMLEPIEWTDDGWPKAPLGARRSDPMPAPMGIAQRPMIDLSDNFQSSTLKPTWNAWNEPDMTRFQLREGALHMRGKGKTFAESPSLIVKARDESYSVEVGAEIDSDSCAVLSLKYNPKCALSVQLKNGMIDVCGPKNVVISSHPWQASAASLRIVNRQNRAAVDVKEIGQDWQNILSDYDVSHFDHNDQKGGFQGMSPALSSIGNGSARFTDFRYLKI